MSGAPVDQLACGVRFAFGQVLNVFEGEQITLEQLVVIESFIR